MKIETFTIDLATADTVRREELGKLIELMIGQGITGVHCAVVRSDELPGETREDPPAKPSRPKRRYARRAKNQEQPEPEKTTNANGERVTRRDNGDGTVTEMRK